MTTDSIRPAGWAESEPLRIDAATVSPSGRARPASAVPRAVAVVLGMLAVYGIFATFARNLELLVDGSPSVVVVASLAGVFAVAMVVWVSWDRLDLAGRWIADRSRTAGRTRWLVGCFLFGVTTRALWSLGFPPVQRSDMASYLDLARTLLRQGEYVIANTYAYWPPGLPLSLVPTLAVLPDHPWIPLLNNLLWFALTLLATYWLGGLLAGDGLAKISTLLITLWPNLVFLSGLAAKELLLVALLPLALGSYLRAARAAGGRATAWGLLAGALLGYAALTQPSFLISPAMLLGYELMRRDRWTTAALRFLALMLGMVVVLTPWTVRNYLVFQAFVPVGTAGGNSLYQGNNPRATGGYVPGLTDDLDQYDEITAARLARERAVEWIRENPGSFAILALRKQRLLLGDDSSGAYGTVKRGLELHGLQYTLLKGISNAYWMVILVLVALAVRRRWPSSILDRPEVALLMLPLPCLLALHSVFESDGRHHVAAAVPLALIAGLALLPYIHARPALSRAARSRP